LWDIATGHVSGILNVDQSGGADSVAFSADSMTVAAAGDDGVIRIWDVATSQALRQSLVGHTGAVTSLAFSPNGRILASGGQDKTIRYWNLATGASLDQPLEGFSAGVTGLAFSPDGRMLASASGTVVGLWRAPVPPVVNTNPSNQPSKTIDLGFSSDASALITAAADGNVVLWDTATGQSKRKALNYNHAEVRIQIGSAIENPYTVALSPDGSTLATAYQSVLEFWDVNAGTSKQQVLGPSSQEQTTLEFSPDGKTLVSANSSSLQFWDVAGRQARGEGQPLGNSDNGNAQPRFAEGGFACLADAVLATRGGRAGIMSRLRYQLYCPHVSAEQLQSLSPPKRALLTFGQDGSTLASVTGSTLQPWDVATGRSSGEAQQLSIAPVDVAFSPDDMTLALLASNGVQLWDLPSRNPSLQLKTPRGPTLQQGTTTITNPKNLMGVEFSPDGRTVAAIGKDGPAFVWSVPASWDIRGRLQSHDQPLVIGTGNVTRILYSRDGSSLAAVDDGNVQLWDASSDQAIGEPLAHMNPATVLSLSPDGRQLAANDGASTHVWDVDVGSWLERICRIANRNLTQDEWTQFVGGSVLTPYQPTCPPPATGSSG